MSDSFWSHGLQHTRLLCPPPSPRVCSNLCPLSWWCYPNISSSAAPFSFYLQSFPALEAFPISQHFASSGQSIEASASASVLAMNSQSWFPLGMTGLISDQSKGLLRVFSSTHNLKANIFLSKNCSVNSKGCESYLLFIKNVFIYKC